MKHSCSWPLSSWHSFPVGHPVGEQAVAKIELAALAEETSLSPNPGKMPSYANRLAQTFAKFNFTPRAVHLVDGWENIIAMVAAGYGVAILPRFRENPRSAVCRLKRLQIPMPPFGLHMVWLQKTPSAAVKIFLLSPASARSREAATTDETMLARRFHNAIQTTHYPSLDPIRSPRKARADYRVVEKPVQFQDCRRAAGAVASSA